jgi:hypothetical protein
MRRWLRIGAVPVIAATALIALQSPAAAEPPTHPTICYSIRGGNGAVNFVYAQCSGTGEGYVRAVAGCWDAFYPDDTYWVYGPWKWARTGGYSYAYCPGAFPAVRFNFYDIQGI